MIYLKAVAQGFLSTAAAILICFFLSYLVLGMINVAVKIERLLP